MRMTSTLWIGLGGMLGSIARFWVTTWVQQGHAGAFPAGTLAVNVVGSFLLGLIGALSLERGLIGYNGRLFLGAGFCGGFTTMSAFSFETIFLIRDGSHTLALLNVFATIGACFAGVWLGGALGRAGSS